MSTEQPEEDASVSVSDEAEQAEAKRRIDIEVLITDVGPCKKHLKIAIPRAEIDRQYEESLNTLRQDALVPGFRPGKAPRQLIVKRFRKQVSDQVKSALLMSSLEQIDEEYNLEPITQPRLDIEAIEIPDKGPLNFELDIEVRPQFDVPTWAGLKIKRPVLEITAAEVDQHLTHVLESHGQVVPKLEGAAELGDYLVADLVFHRPDGSALTQLKEQQFRLQKELRFQNGTIPDAAGALVGAKPGDTRELEASLGSSIEDPDLRGAAIKVTVQVIDLKRLRLPELNQEFLDSINFSSQHELRDAVHEILKRKLRSEQRHAMRQQLVDLMLRQTPFDLPADLVSREERSTVERLVAQLKEEGMTVNEIRARAAQIRANAHETTLRTLKEFMLFGRVAEAQGIKVEEDDLAAEIEEIARRNDESVRRVRARVEKEGGVQSLANQILERKVVDRILEDVEIEDVAVGTAPAPSVETLDFAVSAPVDQAASEPGGSPPETKNP
jgi:trigger factor